MKKLRKDKNNTVWVDTIILGIRIRSRIATKMDFYTLQEWVEM